MGRIYDMWFWLTGEFGETPGAFKMWAVLNTVWIVAAAVITAVAIFG